VSALKAAQRAAIDKLIGRAVHDPTTSVARLGRARVEAGRAHRGGVGHVYTQAAESACEA